MSRIVTVYVKTRLTIRMEEGVEVSEVIDNMDYDFQASAYMSDNVTIEDTEILEHEVIDTE